MRGVRILLRKSDEAKKESAEEKILGNVAELRNRLTDAAREIRNCSYCTEGWRHYFEVHRDRDYSFNRRCHCHKAWQEIYDELKWEFSKLKKATRESYPDLITAEMLNWRNIPIPDEDVVSLRKIKEAGKKIRQLGDKLTAWLPEKEKEEVRW